MLKTKKILTLTPQCRTDLRVEVRESNLDVTTFAGKKYDNTYYPVEIHGLKGGKPISILIDCTEDKTEAEALARRLCAAIEG